MPDVGTRALKLVVDGTEYTSSVSSVTIDSAESDSDFTSFADAAAGGARKYTLGLTLKQNPDANSLWRLMWDETGTEVPVIVRPNGGTAPSATTAEFQGTVIISEPDGTLLGGEANKSGTARMTTSVSWEFLAKPTLDVTP
jgi:hypothetical protein